MAASSFTIYTLRVNLSVAIVGMTGMDRPRDNSTDSNSTLHEVSEFTSQHCGINNGDSVLKSVIFEA